MFLISPEHQTHDTMNVALSFASIEIVQQVLVGIYPRVAPTFPSALMLFPSDTTMVSLFNGLTESNSTKSVDRNKCFLLL